MLNATPSYVIQDETLPTAIAAEATTPRPCHVPDAGFNERPDDDIHSVDADWLPPKPTMIDWPRVGATAMPTTVTLDVPDPCTFLLEPLLITQPSIVITDVIVPTCAATVPTARLAAPTPDTDRAVTLVVDLHAVAAEHEPSNRARIEKSAVPCVDDPTTVTLCAPVIAPLLAVVELGPGPPIVIALVTVPTCSAALTTAPRRMPTPIAALQCNALSDAHSDDIHWLPPTPPRPLYAQCPAPSSPTTVTLWDPVTPTFAVATLLALTPSAVIAPIRLPASINVVLANRSDVQTSDATFAVTALVETHVVVSEALPDTRVQSDVLQVPYPEPTTVTRIPLVLATFTGAMLLISAPSCVSAPVMLPT